MGASEAYQRDDKLQLADLTAAMEKPLTPIDCFCLTPFAEKVDGESTASDVIWLQCVFQRLESLSPTASYRETA